MALYRRFDATADSWTLAPWHEHIGFDLFLRFDDPEAAEAWLRGFDRDALRHLAQRWTDAGRSAQLDDHLVIELLARLLVRGEWRAFRNVVVAERRSPVSTRRIDAAPASFTPSQLAPRPKEEEVLHWVQIELRDDDDEPVAGEPYEIELPDGDKRSGKLDAKGTAYIGNIKTAGSCRVRFPKIDKQEWRAA